MNSNIYKKADKGMAIRGMQAGVLLAGMFAFGNQEAHATISTLNISTATPGSWTVSAEGLVNVNPYFITEQGNNYLISVTSNGFNSGTFLPGGSMASFDGFWIATYTFFLPANATGISMNFSGLYSDDRVALELNGNVLASTGYNAPGVGEMVFTDGGPAVPWTFTGPNGGVGGTVNSGFILGGVNTLVAIIGNTSNGLNGPNVNVGSGDETSFGVNGLITYTTVPEPTTMGVLGMGGALAVLSLAWKRKFSSRA